MILSTDIPYVVDALNGIRASFDNSFRYRRGEVPDAVQGAYLRFEEVRFPFVAEAGRYRPFSSGPGRISSAVERLSFELRQLIEDGRWSEVASDLPFTRQLRMRPSRPPIGKQAAVLLEPEPRSESIEQFVRRLDYVLEGGMEWVELVQEAIRLDSPAEAAARLKRIVPSQKVAPVQFEVSNGRLGIVEARSIPNEQGQHIVGTAKDELVRRGDSLLAQLRNSNCDPRLVSSFEELQGFVETSENVIKIGLANLNCDKLRQAFSSELPDAVGALLQAHSVSVSMMLAQYPDWVTFSESAIALDLTEPDIEIIFDTMIEVAEAAEKDPKIATDEVPRTIRAISEFIKDPSQASKRAGLAALRTLENLVIKVFQYGGDLIEKTISKTVEGISTAASRVAIAALIAAALGVAGGLSAISSSGEGLGWVNDAAAIIQRQLDEMLGK